MQAATRTPDRIMVRPVVLTAACIAGTSSEERRPGRGRRCAPATISPSPVSSASSRCAETSSSWYRQAMSRPYPIDRLSPTAVMTPTVPACTFIMRLRAHRIPREPASDTRAPRAGAAAARTRPRMRIIMTRGASTAMSMAGSRSRLAWSLTASALRASSETMPDTCGEMEDNSPGICLSRSSTRSTILSTSAA